MSVSRRGVGVESWSPSPNCCSFAFLLAFSRALFLSRSRFLLGAPRGVGEPSAAPGAAVLCTHFLVFNAEVSQLPDVFGSSMRTEPGHTTLHLVHLRQQCDSPVTMNDRCGFWNIAIGTEVWLKWKALLGSLFCLGAVRSGWQQGCPTAAAPGPDLQGWGTDCSVGIHLLLLFL